MLWTMGIAAVIGIALIAGGYYVAYHTNVSMIDAAVVGVIPMLVGGAILLIDVVAFIVYLAVT